MAETFYRQCNLLRGNVAQVAWLPEQFAQRGKHVRLNDEDGWLVVSASVTRIPHSYLAEYRDDYRRQREALLLRRLERDLAAAEASVKAGDDYVQRLHAKVAAADRLAEALQKLRQDEWRGTIDWGPREGRDKINDECDAALAEWRSLRPKGDGA